MRDLTEIRHDINNVDNELKKLFLKRMEYVDQVREYKQATNTPVKNPGREADIIRSKLEGVDKFKSETEEFFKSMIEISCNYQDQHLLKKRYEKEFKKVSESDFFSGVQTVAYQGIEGSYSHEVATEFFENKDVKNLDSFKDVVYSVIDGTSDVGVLPVENLTVGCVTDVYDLLKEHEVYVTMCYDLKINHCLAGKGDVSKITSVVSHSQALRQCAKYIDSKGFKKNECNNTAVAAKSVADSKDCNVAVICSKACAKLYSLNILEENISDLKNNVTRFVFITKKPIIVDTADKASVIFTIKHESGSLARILNDFAKNDINMTKIESRPSKNDEWKYVFYVDLILPEFDIIEYFSKIRYMFEDFKISGIYKTLR